MRGAVAIVCRTRFTSGRWVSYHPTALRGWYESLLRGRSVNLFRTYAESEAAPQLRGKFTAANALTQIERYDCETEGAAATCRIWLEESYDIDSAAPEFDLEAALAWSYYELHFDRSKRGVRLVEVHEVRGTDCTNC